MIVLLCRSPSIISPSEMVICFWILFCFLFSMSVTLGELLNGVQQDIQDNRKLLVRVEQNLNGLELLLNELKSQLPSEWKLNIRYEKKNETFSNLDFQVVTERNDAVNTVVSVKKKEEVVTVENEEVSNSVVNTVNEMNPVGSQRPVISIKKIPSMSIPEVEKGEKGDFVAKEGEEEAVSGKIGEEEEEEAREVTTNFQFEELSLEDLPPPVQFCDDFHAYEVQLFNPVVNNVIPKAEVTVGKGITPKDVGKGAIPTQNFNISSSNRQPGKSRYRLFKGRGISDVEVNESSIN